MSVHAVAFPGLVAEWCLTGAFFATRPVIAKALSRWGRVLLPLVLITLGLGTQFRRRRGASVHDMGARLRDRGHPAGHDQGATMY